jgi:hypothetical protein
MVQTNLPSNFPCNLSSWHSESRLKCRIVCREINQLRLAAMPPEQKVGGSNPLGRTTPNLAFQSLTGRSRKSDIRKNDCPTPFFDNSDLQLTSRSNLGQSGSQARIEPLIRDSTTKRPARCVHHPRGPNFLGSVLMTNRPCAIRLEEARRRVVCP